MKGLLVTFIAMMVLLIISVNTVPADRDIIRQVRDKVGLGNIVGSVVINEATVQIEDNVFYKTIINRFDGSVMGYAYFGTVKINN